METIIAGFAGVAISIFGLALGWTIGALFYDDCVQEQKMGGIVLLISAVASAVLILLWQIIQL